MDTEQLTTSTSFVFWKTHLSTKSGKTLSLVDAHISKKHFFWHLAHFLGHNAHFLRTKICYCKINVTSNKYTEYRRMFQRILGIFYSISYATNKWETWYRFSAEAKDYFLLSTVKEDSVGHTASCSISVINSVPKGKSAEARSWLYPSTYLQR